MLVLITYCVPGIMPVATKTNHKAMIHYFAVPTILNAAAGNER